MHACRGESDALFEPDCYFYKIHNGVLVKGLKKISDVWTFQQKESPIKLFSIVESSKADDFEVS